MTLLEIQDTVAKEKAYCLWDDLTAIGRSRCWPEVAERYAIEKTKGLFTESQVRASIEASLKRAAENCRDEHGIGYEGSIVDRSNIVIVK